MAVKKKMKAKAKASSKTRRRKAPARQPVARRKIAKPARKVARKPARKAPARRAVRKAAKAKVARPQAAMPSERPAPGERIGVVTHYYGAPMVAIVKLETGTLRIGDTIHIRGHTSDFSQLVASIQVDHAPVEEVGPQDDFGIKVNEHVREHDVVYKLPR
jgi:hypothetical protein